VESYVTVVHLAAMEGHSECVRYLVMQLLKEKEHQTSLCGTSAAHPVLGVSNNLGESPRALALRFYKYVTVETIDQLLSQLKSTTNDDGIIIIITIIIIIIIKLSCQTVFFPATNANVC